MAHWSLAWTANVPSTSRLFHLLLITLVLSLSVRADDDTTLIPTAASDSFPSCALSCSILQQAQTGCVPPTAQKTDRSTYVSCFCQSSLITQLHNSADGTCSDTCTNADDRKKLQTWYSDFCASGGQNKGTAASESTAAASTSTSTSTSTTKSQNSYPAPKSWWSTHYQWVIMVIVLAVGFTAIAVVGVWLKRRHDAKYPNLYHAGSGSNSGSNSGLLYSRGQNASPGPKHPGQFMPAPSPINHDEYANTDSVASSSRTEVAVPGPRPSRLQRTPPSADVGDIETREVTR
ncbi:hypothetical protein BDV32DRAFT_115757 [Aspergillus pseudonomiae]|uniref:Uncharacterized protein n=1 Tax=Aspergillus pseudonomiae TaxID=1506151 RepID=A0A5N6IHL0_9EURO|nr:uncharacterized protein BDV37DRAFT_281585 [Aspergillus pseudonomiae]KAB8265704.1 hypothetical protein BDV32DRAFT_115757 [Aspergillus pseudonomiae]KAE8405752.1 hypothetical protein BDV37DRAFT_281585 [Aspergillus pseudonomiae]